MGPRVLASSELYTVDVIYTRYTVKEVKTKKKCTDFSLGCILMPAAWRGKKNKCVHSRHLSGNERSVAVQ